MVKQASLYERIGGQTEVTRLANQFYNVMQRDAAASHILNLHPANLTRSRKRLAHYLCEWFGGPKLFGEPYVNPEWLRLRHRHLNIGLEERDQWMHCMSTAMIELNYADELQKELNKAFFQLAGYLRTRV